ncbi:MAG: DUF1127 domain-containing protein [Paracoccaceae bacterium]
MSTQVCTAPKANGTKIWRFSPLRLIRKYDAIYQQRQTLRNLSDTALKDIGLTKPQANAEASRPVWDAPSHWLR